MSYATIAQRLGVQPATVRSRVRYLISNNFISVAAEAQPRAFGYAAQSGVLLTCAPGADIRKVAARLGRIPEVFYIVMTTNAASLELSAYHRSAADLEGFLDRHCRGGSDISGVDSCIILQVYKARPRWRLTQTRSGLQLGSVAVTGPPDHAAAGSSEPARQREIAEDPLNLQILDLLQQDGRMSFSAIATRTGVSVVTVSNRVSLMRKQGIMSINAVARPAAFGYPVEASIRLKLTPGARRSTVAMYYQSLPQTYYVAAMTSSFDLIVSSSHRSIRDLQEFLLSHCHGRNNVAEVETNLLLETFKIRPKWSDLLTA